MVQENSRCRWCGASISETDKECPACGEAITRHLVKRVHSDDYSGVFQQQGRMITDADWNESPRITKTRERIKVASVRCPSCGANNIARSKFCAKCGANLTS